MKKILHKLRVWLIERLGGVHHEWADRALKVIENLVKALEIATKEREELRKSADREIKAHQKAMREICRRSENSYYDWCCDYCVGSTDCKHNSWCPFFIPRNDL